jgi:BirA family biotin operon repressor/biotin-[acetyl-CoA-carboxylase] ligase
MDDLEADRILAGLRGTRFTRVDVRASVDSTQRRLVAEGGPDGRVLVADHQSAGRGRLGRTWESPPGTSLLFSVLVRDIAPDRAPLTGLAAGVAVARSVDGIDPTLKWPNDVLVGGRKLAGILGELAPGGAYVVVGIGVNVRQTREELPPDVKATSLALEGADVRRDDLLVSILGCLDRLLDGSDWMDEYRSLCSTIGTRVRVQTSSGPAEGTVDGVRDDGALIVDGTAVTAGDVVSVR